MRNSTSDIIVFIWLKGKGYVPAAKIIKHNDARSCLEFGYGARYLKSASSIPVDPVCLPLFGLSSVFSASNIPMFSALGDMVPDKWGRKLFSLMAGRHSQALTELDILTAVHSEKRIGAIAFGRSPSDGPVSFATWADGTAQTLRLADLERVVKVVEAIDEVEDDDEIDHLRKILLEDAFFKALTSSLNVGGGRPKVLISENGNEYICKFPKRGDLWNEPRIEFATMQLAKKCGIKTADTELISCNNTCVLLVKRFDRDQDCEPRHFVSGFTMLNLPEEGELGSYQDLAQVARSHGDSFAGPELFRRMIFNVLCSNIDDHLRNHAFFVDRYGVNITPAYDIVPTQARIREKSLALKCGFYGREASLNNVLSETSAFGLQYSQAQQIVFDMIKTMKKWKTCFKENGVTDREISDLEFRFGDVETWS